MTRVGTRWIFAAIGGYALALVLIALWPTPVDQSAGPWLNEFLAKLHRHGFPKWIGYRKVEFGANILFFLPLGLLAMWWTRRFRVTLILGVALSGLIELSQLLFLPNRYPSLWDILANSLGTLCGAVLFIAYVWFEERRMRRDFAST